MIVELSISTWVGSAAVEASHYYGTLRSRDQKTVRLERALTARQAAYQNRYDNTPGMYEEGTLTERFDSEETVRECAVAVWLEHYPGGSVLISGDRLNPGPVLAGRDPELIGSLNELAARAEKYADAAGAPRELTEIYTEWDQLLKGER